MVLNRAVGPVGRAGHPGTPCAVLACILLHTCRTRVLPNASAPRSYALTTARHASLIWRKRCWWLFTSVLARVLEHGTRAEQWWSAGVVVGNERQRTHSTTDAAVALHWTRLSERRWWVGANACTHAIPGWRSADWPHRHDGWTHGHTHGTRGTLAARTAAELTRRSQSVRPTLWPRPSPPARSPSLRQTQVYLHGCKVQRVCT